MKVFGLIGNPLIQSFSKRYFTEKFEKESIPDAVFELFPLQSIGEFPGLIQKQNELKGLAVTIPYKQTVIPYLSDLDDGAAEIGAVNCISVNGSSLIGYNTDVIGFEKSFVPILQPHHTKAIILGTGGASKAVQYVLKKIGIEFLLASRVPSYENNIIGYDFIDAHMLHSYPVVINCTPVGMVPNENEAPVIPYEFLDKKNFLYDLIYKPSETLFIKKGAARGATVKNGYEMLVLQAEENWKIWNRNKSG